MKITLLYASYIPLRCNMLILLIVVFASMAGVTLGRLSRSEGGYYSEASGGSPLLWPDCAPLLIAAAVSTIATVLLWVLDTWFAATSVVLLELTSSTTVAAIVAFSLAFIAGSRWAKTKAICADLFDGALGKGKHHPWALQAVLGLALFLMALGYFSPETFAHLTSFRAGEFEAKFDRSGEVTRQAIKLDLREISRQVTVSQWKDFNKNLQAGMPRAVVATWDQESQALKEPRSEARNTFFKSYLTNLATAINCLQDDSRSAEFLQDRELTKLAYKVRSLVLSFNSAKPTLNNIEWMDLIEEVNCVTGRYAEEIRSEIAGIKNQDCEELQAKLPRPTQIKNDIKSLVTTSDKILDEMSRLKRQSNGLSEYKLIGVDPYFVSALSDLIALTSGQSERASFLAEVVDRYPYDPDQLHPGILNIHFQLVDARLKSITSWPFDDTQRELMKLIEMNQSIVDRAEKEGNDSVRSLYMTNKLVFLSALVEAICSRQLAGEEIPRDVHEAWASAYTELQAVLRLDSKGAVTRLVDAVEPTFTDKEQSLLRKALRDMPPSYLFDIYVDLAVSAVTIASERNTVSHAACETASYYVGNAKTIGDEIIKGPTKSEKLQVEGFLSQLSSRIKAACA